MLPKFFTFNHTIALGCQSRPLSADSKKNPIQWSSFFAVHSGKEILKIKHTFILKKISKTYFLNTIHFQLRDNINIFN